MQVKTHNLTRRSVSLRDVADRAGIAVPTASAVLNGARSNTKVSAATRERILAAAKDLNYQPNKLASALAGRRTNILGVLFGLPWYPMTMTYPFAYAVFHGIVSGAAAFKYSVTLHTEVWQNAEQSLGWLNNGFTDGLIVIAADKDSDVLVGLQAANLPFVAVSSTCEGLGVPNVDIDNRAGIRLGLDHLIELGHRRIAHLAGEPCFGCSTVRQDEFRSRMEESGLGSELGASFPGSFLERSGYERTMQLLQGLDRPTAIFAANDGLAVGAMQAVRDCGLRVPEDVSIIGFDDIAASSMTTPPLTTIRQPLHEIGRVGAEMLIERLLGTDDGTRTHLFAPELVLRDSTAPASA